MGYLATWAYGAFDKGVSSTYRCAELESQASERADLRDILAATWVGRQATEAENVLAGAGLLQFRKGDEAIVAGGPDAAPISFELEGGLVKDIGISATDGRCAPLQGEN